MPLTAAALIILTGDPVGPVFYGSAPWLWQLPAPSEPVAPRAGLA